jgi:hypothetical protein
MRFRCGSSGSFTAQKKPQNSYQNNKLMELDDASSEAQRLGAESLSSNMTRLAPKQDPSKKGAQPDRHRDAATGLLAPRAAIG